jgi:Phage integrase, N-terminal SAM-like domain
MQKHCPDNERIKREYRKFLKHAHGRSEASLDMAAKAIDRFEQYTHHRNFKEFRRQQAIAFGEHLAEQKNERNGNALSRATRHSTLAALRSFFRWLAREPGYKSRIAYHDADYFSLSERDGRIARTRLAKAYPSLKQVQDVIRSMPAGSAVRLRDRAVVALIHWRPRWRDLHVQAQASRRCPRCAAPGCARGRDQARQELRQLLLSRGGGRPQDRRRLGYLPRTGARIRPR